MSKPKRCYFCGKPILSGRKEGGYHSWNKSRGHRLHFAHAKCYDFNIKLINVIRVLLKEVRENSSVGTKKQIWNFQEPDIDRSYKEHEEDLGTQVF